MILPETCQARENSKEQPICPFLALGPLMITYFKFPLEENMTVVLHCYFLGALWNNWDTVGA